MNKLTNKLKLQKGQSGFTIIEVLIVLAIGALIILAVLLAVPALQKNQKNSQRKSEASRIAAAAASAYSDANATMPTSGPDLYDRAGLTTTKSIIQDVIVTAATNDTAPTLVASKVTVLTGAKCNGTGVTYGATTTNKNIAVYYPLDGGTTIGGCLDAQ
jgi:prepilin-type N-terminal cleavage/methylation domain-containing protein